MKFLGVSGVFDYAGLSRSSRYRACSCCLPHITKSSAPGFTVFGAEYPPRLYLCPRFAGSLTVAAQDSRPSGSLILSREASSSSASCRVIPAHCNGLVSTPNLVIQMTSYCNRLICRGLADDLFFMRGALSVAFQNPIMAGFGKLHQIAVRGIAHEILHHLLHTGTYGFRKSNFFVGEIPGSGGGLVGP